MSFSVKQTEDLTEEGFSSGETKRPKDSEGREEDGVSISQKQSTVPYCEFTSQVHRP